MPGRHRNPESTRIAIAPAWLRVSFPGPTWLRMQELHLKATGNTDFGYSPAVKKLKPAQAITAYSSTLACVLGQVAVAEGDLATSLMSSLNDYAATVRTLGGLEAPFLSAFAACYAVSGHTAVTEQAVERWLSLGQPPTLGGGALQTPLVSAGGVISLVGADNLGRALRDARDVESFATAIEQVFAADTVDADDPGDEVYEITLAVFQVALAIAAAAEIQTHVNAALAHADPTPPGSPQPAGPADPSFDRLTRALRLATYQGHALLRAEPSRQFVQLARGKAIVVELGTLGTDAGDEGAEPAHPGAQPAIRPSFAHAASEVEAAALWASPALDPIGALHASGPGVENALQERMAGFAMSALPRLQPGGWVLPRGLLTAMFAPPPGTTARGAPTKPGRMAMRSSHPGDMALETVDPTAHIPSLSELKTSLPIHVVIMEDPSHAIGAIGAIDAGTLAQTVREIVTGAVSEAKRDILAEITRSRATDKG